jgi:hypothetical protein
MTHTTAALFGNVDYDLCLLPTTNGIKTSSSCRHVSVFTSIVVYYSHPRVAYFVVLLVCSNVT